MNLSFKSLIEMVSSLIQRSRRMTLRCRKKISPSRLYCMSKNCWQIFFRSLMEVESKSALVLLQNYERLSHWLHLFDFSPLCVFKCALKPSASEEALSHRPEHSEMPISTLETRSRISSFQSHASRQDREFLPFSLMFRDEIENFFPSVSYFETRMRMFFSDLIFETRTRFVP